MNVTQDLMDWLNGKNFSQTREDLLIAPVNNERTENQEAEKLQDNTQEILRTLYPIEEPENFSDDANETETENFSRPAQEEPEPQEIHDLEPAPEYDNLLEVPQDFHEQESAQEIPQDSHEQESTQEIPQDFHEQESTPEIPQDTHEQESAQEIPQDSHEAEPSQEISDPAPAGPKPSGLSENWKEAAKSTGFVLSLDEPPPEIWTRINANDTDYEEDYEQGTSLQGPAYAPKHGANFTQRLQKTLHDRKARAEERARKEKEDSEKHNHPHLKKGALMCAALLLTLALSWVALMLLQTVKISRDNFAAKEIAQEIHSEPTPTPEPEPEQKPEPESQRQEIIIKFSAFAPQTFDEILNEANNAFNEKRYNRAAENFFKALEMRSNDIRPYIGLAASYRAKGLFFDAKKILDDARKNFGNNISIDAEENFLQRE